MGRLIVAYVVASLDKALYDDYSCLVASNRSQINSAEYKNQPEHSQMDNSLSGCGFVQNIAPPSLSCNRKIKVKKILSLDNSIKMLVYNIIWVSSVSSNEADVVG